MTPLLYPAQAIIFPGLLAIGVDISREGRLRRHSDFLLQSLLDVSEQRLQNSNDGTSNC